MEQTKAGLPQLAWLEACVCRSCGLWPSPWSPRGPREHPLPPPPPSSPGAPTGSSLRRGYPAEWFSKTSVARNLLILTDCAAVFLARIRLISYHYYRKRSTAIVTLLKTRARRRPRPLCSPPVQVRVGTTDRTGLRRPRKAGSAKFGFRMANQRGSAFEEIPDPRVFTFVDCVHPKYRWR